MSDYRYQKIDPKDRYYMKSDREGGIIRLMPLGFPAVIAAVFALMMLISVIILINTALAGGILYLPYLGSTVLKIFVVQFIGLFLINVLRSGRSWHYHIEDSYLRIFNGKKFYIFQYKSVRSITGRYFKIGRKTHLMLVTVDSAPMGKQKFIYIFPISATDKTLDNTVFGLLQQKVNEAKQGDPPPAYEWPARPLPMQTPVFSDPVTGKTAYDPAERFDMFDTIDSGLVYLYKTYYKVLQAIVTAVALMTDVSPIITYLIDPENISAVIAMILLALTISVFAGVAVTFLKGGQRWKYSAEYDRLRLFRKNEEHILFYKDILTVAHEEILIHNRPYGVNCAVEHLTANGSELLEFTCIYHGKRTDKKYERTPFYILETHIKS